MERAVAFAFQTLIGTVKRVIANEWTLGRYDLFQTLIGTVKRERCKMGRPMGRSFKPS